jgi:anaerobic magnesium-protoporphyrin IX monomethyl ester cyclase
MKSVALIDYKHPQDGYANRDVTGTFGSAMHADGLFGSLVTGLKKNKLRVPNITLAYLKAIAGEHGIPANHYNGMPKGESYVIIASSMHQYKNEVELAKRIKAEYPGTKIGFTGAFSSTKPEFFEEVSEFIFKEEPELAFRQFCEGERELTGMIELNEEIDVKTLPFPDWDGIDLAECGYFPALMKKPFLTIQASRGCPFACDFCPYIVLQKEPLRRRDNNNIIAEMRSLVERYGIRSLLFSDITFSLHRRETKALLRAIAAEDFCLEIGCETRLDCMDDEMVDLMIAAGFKAINIGIESPEEEVLKSSGRRPIEHQKMESLIDRLERGGIRVQAFYILGLVGDTEQSMENTIQYSRFLNTFSAQFGILTPFPGTKSAERLTDRITTFDYSKYTEYDPVVRLDDVTPEQILKKKNRAFNGYYFRPSWMIKHGFGLVKEWSVALLKGSSPRTDVLTPKSTTTRTVEVSDETEAVEEMVLSD